MAMNPPPGATIQTGAAVPPAGAAPPPPVAPPPPAPPPAPPPQPQNFFQREFVGLPVWVWLLIVGGGALVVFWVIPTFFGGSGATAATSTSDGTPPSNLTPLQTGTGTSAWPDQATLMQALAQAQGATGPAPVQGTALLAGPIPGPDTSGQQGSSGNGGSAGSAGSSGNGGSAGTSGNGGQTGDTGGKRREVQGAVEPPTVLPNLQERTAPPVAQVPWRIINQVRSGPVVGSSGMIFRAQ